MVPGLARQTPGFNGADLAKMVNEGGTARGGAGEKADRPRGVGRGNRASHRRPAAEEPDPLTEGAEAHGLPRGGTRPVWQASARRGSALSLVPSKSTTSRPRRVSSSVKPQTTALSRRTILAARTHTAAPL